MSDQLLVRNVPQDVRQWIERQKEEELSTRPAYGDI